MFLAGSAEFITSLQAADKTTSPNILIIMADDMGYSDLGCYGSEIQTPQLDRLAQHGLKFTQFYNTARCWPTRAALISGYYPQQMGIDPRLKPVTWARTIPQLLQAKNYRSYHTGKWHLDAFPTAVKSAGFDHSYRVEDHNNYFHPQRHILDDQKQPPVKPDDKYYVTTEVTNQMLTFLRAHRAEHQQQPFFAYLAYTSPHFPLHALPEDIAIYRDMYKQGWDKIRAARFQKQQALGFPAVTQISQPEKQLIAPSGNPERMQQLGAGEIDHAEEWDKLTPEQQEFQADKMAIHAAMIHRMDLEIGRVMAQLEAMNAMQNTLIFFLSDNGASAEILVRGDGHDPKVAPGSAESFLCLGPGWANACNTPFRRYKIWNHEGGISTPLIVHWPQGITASNAFRHSPGHVIDLMPTILDVVGLPLNPVSPQAPPLPGKSLKACFAEDTIVPRDAIYFSHSGNRALFKDQWKIVSSPEDQNLWSLFDLHTDRSETIDLISKQSKRAEQMIAEWEKLDQQFKTDYASSEKITTGKK
jgi:arylsulfatase